MLTYRMAAAADGEWLYSLKRATLRTFVEATWGPWDDNDQRGRFAASFRPAETEIIQQDGQPVGVLRVREEDKCVYLADLAVWPDRQHQGIGREAIAAVLTRAMGRGKPVRLQVLKVNPARELYARLGFAIIGDTATHFVMEHPAPAAS